MHFHCGMTLTEGMAVEISSGLIGCSSRISTLSHYLLQIKDSAMRRSLCCFHISCHPLQIGRGRYRRPRPIPAGQRYCPLCHKRGRDAVENETNFLLGCNSYADIVDKQCLLFQSTAAHLPSLFFLCWGRANNLYSSLRGPHRNYVHCQVCPYMFLKSNELISCLCSD